MKYALYIIIGVALLLFASCGRQQQAKSAVKDFIGQQLQRQEVSYLDFSTVDSTHAITDSLILTMRKRGGSSVQYQERTGNTLLHIRTQYVSDGDTLSATFYLDSPTMGVVAYKEN